MKDISNHFRLLTSYDGTTNIVQPDIWACWMVDQFTISLIHLDTRLHTTTLCTPQIGDVDETVMINTLKDINELIKYSITNISYKECVPKETYIGVDHLVTPLRKSNFMFYVSLDMAIKNYFSCNEFEKKLTN